MKMQEIKKMAMRMGIKPGKIDKVELIRAIQRAEGNRDCFATSAVKDCNQTNCLWRKDCVEAM